MAVSQQSLRAVPSASFGDLLRRQRSIDGLTQAKLGTRFGVTQQTIGAWEHDDERPRSRFFDDLADYLAIEVKELVELIDTQWATRNRQEETGKTADYPDDDHRLMMLQLANDFTAAQRKGVLTSDAARAYRELFKYFGRTH